MLNFGSDLTPGGGEGFMFIWDGLGGFRAFSDKVMGFYCLFRHRL
jgi:hypothetical protein